MAVNAAALRIGMVAGEQLDRTPLHRLSETSDPGEPIATLIGERSFEAHEVPHGDGTVTWWLVEDTRLRHAHARLRTELDRVQLLSEMCASLPAAADPDECIRVTAQLAADHLADAAWVITPGGLEEFPVTMCVRGDAPVHSRVAVCADELEGLGEVLTGLPPVPSSWIDPASAPAWLIPEDFGEIGSIMVTALPGPGVPVGALVLLRRCDRHSFTEQDEAFARQFAARAGAVISTARALSAQASVTEMLMRDLRPPEPAPFNGVEFAGRYRPASESDFVGGGFFDVYSVDATDPYDASEWLAVLGTVGEREMAAAVLTGKARSVLSALAPVTRDHQLMLRLLHNAVAGPHQVRFPSLALASVTRTGARLHLRLTCGGHLSPLVVRSDGAVEEVSTSTVQSEAMPQIVSSTAAVALRLGDMCLLYTAGITEAVGGPQGDQHFGDDRLRAALAAMANTTASAVAEHIHMRAAEWSEHGHHDDIALLAIAASEGRHLAAVDGRARRR
ncbi:PP2C family protein-serine/threonine phosphatase [Amycolatopsis oliviviridis]|uniref:PP2C family protein-serine/threonine phosphatase n=1 Tax=Amycolatopsis oliviviridis TaxID=1471590 RepID=UPI001E304310|nr:SpoIIE family protein phosphatase [Amycolatopsis oliviviridis]